MLLHKFIKGTLQCPIEQKLDTDHTGKHQGRNDIRSIKKQAAFVCMATDNGDSKVEIIRKKQEIFVLGS